MSIAAKLALSSTTRLAGGLALGLLLLALLASCAAAPGRLVVDDTTAILDRAQLEAAAAPLLARGALVGVFLAARGDDTGADLQGRLGAAGLLAGEEIAPAALAVYISLEPRYSELRAGRRWSAALPDATLRAIRLEALNPALRDGAPTAGLAATLGALEERLANPPLGVRLRPWLIALPAGLFLTLILWLTPGGEQLRRSLRRSPPGRLAEWLWDQTPGGRRSLERALRTMRDRLDHRVEYARSWSRSAREPAGVAPSETLAARLAGLDRQRDELLRTQRGRALLRGMDRLAWDYQELGSAAERLQPPKPPAKRGKGRSGGGTPFVAGGPDTPATYGSASSDSSTSGWDYGGPSDAGGPSSDGGSW